MRYIILCNVYSLCVFPMQVMVLLNTQPLGLPAGIFECDPDQWKLYRHITLPAFTNLKLRKVFEVNSCTL